MKKVICIWIAILFCILVGQGCNPDDPSDSGFSNLEEELNYLVGQYVKMGAAIGIVNKQQQELEFYFGRLSDSDSTSPNRHTVFEIGSITKTFTGLLLARMILDSRIALNTTVQSYLPENQLTMPTWNGIEITIRHLATHSSGLPKAPQDSNYPLPSGYDPTDPYAAYTTEHIYEYLTDFCKLQFEPETGLNYSNTGAGLLGHILGRREGTSYQESLSRKILIPLNLMETSVVLTDQQAANLAPGYNKNLLRVNIYHWTDIFQGAGAIKSSLHDMMIYLKANMGLISTPLRQAMALSQQTHFDVGEVNYSDRYGDYRLAIGLLWHIDVLPEGYTFCYHGGRTRGYMTYIGFDKANMTGVVILCNQSSENLILRFGEQVLKAVNKY